MNYCRSVLSVLLWGGRIKQIKKLTPFLGSQALILSLIRMSLYHVCEYEFLSRFVFYLLRTLQFKLLAHNRL